MNFKVHMLAFMDRGTVRNVEVPDDELKGATVTIDADPILNAIFKYGQNDFATNEQHLPSVSVGDVIELSSRDYFMVRPSGFLLITRSEFERLPDHIGSLAYGNVDGLLKKKDKKS